MLAFYWLSIPIGLGIIIGAILALILFFVLCMWLGESGAMVFLVIPIIFCLIVIIGYGVSGQEPPVWTIVILIASFALAIFSAIAAGS